MLGEPKNQFSLTRAALSTCGRAKSNLSGGVLPPGVKKPVERLFPFVLRSRILVAGRDNLARSKGKLHFVLITRDLSEGSREDVLRTFAHYPVVQHFTSADLEKHFAVKGAKVIGFQKPDLAQSIYSELKEHRVNLPLHPSKGQQPAK
jgi:hypothetical protein